ncbi:MAG TPA: hypothetical protein VGM19_07510 [Armatimonadota bacterium]
MYLAQLIPTHPLYPAYQRLTEQIAREQAARPGPFPPMMGWQIPVLSGPELGAYPRASLQADLADWEAGLTLPPAYQPGVLPADLEASRRWRYRLLDLDDARQLEALQATESRRLAAVRERLVRDRLADLANAGGDLTVPAAEAQQRAEQERQAIWDEINKQLAQEQTASDAKIALAQEKLNADAVAARAAIDAEVKAEAATRQTNRLPALTTSRQEMQQKLRGLASSLGPEARPAPLRGVAPLPGSLEQSSAARAATLAAVDQARRQELQRLRDSQAQLLRSLLADVRLAALRVAFEQNLRLTLVPSGEPTGPDLTDQVRTNLQQMWSQNR